MIFKKIVMLSFSLLAFTSLSIKAETVIETTTIEQGNGIVRDIQHYDNASKTPSNVYMAPPYVKMQNESNLNIQKDKLQLREDEESLKNAYDHLNYEKTNPSQVGSELYYHNINESKKIVSYYEKIVDSDRQKLQFDLNKQNTPSQSLY